MSNNIKYCHHQKVGRASSLRHDLRPPPPMPTTSWPLGNLFTPPLATISKPSSATSPPTTTSPRPTATSPTLPQAKADALNLCNNFAATSRYHLKSATIDVQHWNCEKSGATFSCGFNGQAVCQLEERSTKSDETCGK